MERRQAKTVSELHQIRIDDVTMSAKATKSSGKETRGVAVAP
jgi:hypothetical protein